MLLDKDHIQFITEIKEKVRQAQYEALKAVNIELINLYWEMGKSIAEKQAMGWGKAIVPTLAKELQKEFPKMIGLSAANLWLMAQFYTEYHQDKDLVPMVRDLYLADIQCKTEPSTTNFQSKNHPYLEILLVIL